MANIDANLLIYLCDSASQFHTVAQRVALSGAIALGEVFAEVVYTLHGIAYRQFNVTHSGRESDDLARFHTLRMLCSLIDNYPRLSCDRFVLRYALQVYCYTGLDWVDAILISRALRVREEFESNDNWMREMYQKIVTHSGRIPLRRGWTLSTECLPETVYIEEANGDAVGKMSLY